MNFKSLYASVNNFVRTHLLLLLIIAALIWLLYPGHVSPVPFQNYGRGGGAEMAMMDMAESEPMLAMSKRSGYGGNVMADMGDEFAPESDDRKIIRNARLTVEVADTEDGRTNAEIVLKEVGGSVTNMHSWEVRPGVLGYNLTMRVPAENLDATMIALAELGVKKSESLSMRDITASYQDAEGRLNNLRARRDRLRDMMDRETDKLADVLAIDRELANVQTEIERLERTQKGRDTDVAYSTLNLTIQPEPQVGDVQNPHWSPERSWKKAVNQLIEKLQGLADLGIEVIVFAPLWIPVLLIVWGVWRWKKK